MDVLKEWLSKMWWGRGRVGEERVSSEDERTVS